MAHRLFQLLLLLMATWMVLQLTLRYLGHLVVMLVVLVASLTAVTLYMLRFHRLSAAAAYKLPVLKQWLDLVCRIAGQQSPVEAREASELSQQIMLREARDFDWAVGKLRSEIFGHDGAVEQMFSSLRQNILLRSRAPEAGRYHPLGIYLLVGPEGIGKRHLALALSARLYRDGRATVLNLADYAQDPGAEGQLFGTATQEGQLLRPIRQHPHQLLVLEGLETLGTRLQERMRSVLQSGICTDPRNRGIVSFEHVVFVFTIPRRIAGLDQESRQQMPPERWRENVTDSLTAEAGLSPALLSCFHEIVVLDPPDPLTKARVIASLMQSECQRYNLSLDYVDPEIIAAEVESYSEAYGFHLCKTQIARRLQTPILKASENELTRLVLTQESDSSTRTARA